MNNAVQYSFAGRNWRPYTSLETSPAEMTGDYLESWLRDGLRLLALPAVFLQKVVTSAQDAVIVIPEGVSRVRLSVFTPDPLLMAGQTWGFFRMVKANTIPENRLAGIYEIVFYLYAESTKQPE